MRKFVPGKIVRNTLIGIGGLIVVVAIAAFFVLQTNWFRNYAREKIVSATESATGGRVEVGSFNFNVSQMRAVVTGFVIHGREPAGAAPFIRIARIDLQIRLLPGLRHLYDIAYVGVTQPQANLIVLADGRTNVPAPAQKSTSNKTALETVVDLAIDRFQLTDGMFTVESRKQPLNVRGNNLRAQLAWNTLTQGYQGTLSLQPLYLVAGRNTPVTATITLPVTLQGDRIDIRNGSVATPGSAIQINASVANLRDPKLTTQISGHIATTDLRNAGGLPLAAGARDVPAQIDLDANATVSSNVIQVSDLRVRLGMSRFDASGTLKGSGSDGVLIFQTRLDPAELGRLFMKTVKPVGIVTLDGDARMTGDDLQVSHLRAAALGAQFDGSASLARFESYSLNGNLRGLDIQTVLRAMNEKLPWDGVVSGTIRAAGDTKTAGAQSVTAEARLDIAPERRGLPVSGHINLNYNGRADNLSIENSYVALPHTRLSVDGSLEKTLDISLTSRDLWIFWRLVPANGPPPVALNGGTLNFEGAVTGSLAMPNVTGHLAANRFTIEGRRFDMLAADVAASGSGAAIRNGSLTRGTQADAMQVQFAAATGLRNWKLVPSAPVSADIAVRRADLADALALAGQRPDGYAGPLTAMAHISGTAGNPRGAATVDLGAGTIDGEPFDRAQLQVNLTDRLVTIPTAYIQSGAGRASLTAEYRHPADSFDSGALHAHLQTNQIDLADIRTIEKNQPSVSGSLQLNADLTADKKAAGIVPTAVNVDISARGIKVRGQNYGDLTATARTANQTVSYNVVSDFAGSNVHVNGTTRLVSDYPTTADVTIASLPVERVLALADRADIPARGTLAVMAHVSGTVRNPQGNADLELTKAVLYNEPIDRARLRIAYQPDSIDVPELNISYGPARIELTAHYDHPAGDLQRGSARFNLNSSRIDLMRIGYVQRLRPGLAGTLEIAASGEGMVRPNSPRILFSDLNAHVAANGIASEGKNFGDLMLTANTAAGNRLNFTLDSNLADAAIHGSGNAQLRDDYPVTAQLSFKNILYTHIAALLGTAKTTRPGLEAATDGEVTINGPVLAADRLRGTLQLTRLNLTGAAGAGAAARSVSISNQGPIAVSLDAGTVRIQSAHLTGPQTDIQAAGTASLRTLNLNVNANADLALLADFNRDIDSSGKIDLKTTIHGTPSQPLINGQLALQNASLNYRGIENGLSDANGVIAFNGNSARIQNLTAVSGGGKITLAGFVGYANLVRFGLRANGTSVRIRTTQGASVVVTAELGLSGTTNSSVASGTVTVNEVSYNPQSDFGSILSGAGPPVQSPSSSSPVLENMKLDIHVQTANGLAVRASLARNLQADADLQIRGTAAMPGILGRVTINEGQLVFFGSTYTVSQGSISFFDPLRIEPVLDLTLETKAKSVSVVLHVTGPIDNMNLSYTSDPPLQFQEIVALLASGKTPTSDPTLLANQPQAPSQSVQQMGESAVLSKAVAEPVSNQLARVFGVTQFKIDPSFTAGTSVPTARLTLQQQITSNLTFTYTSALDDPNGQIIKVEWTFTPEWAAVANRDQNGIFSINFLYRRQFR